MPSRRPPRLRPGAKTPFRGGAAAAGAARTSTATTTSIRRMTETLALDGAQVDARHAHRDERAARKLLAEMSLELRALLVVERRPEFLPERRVERVSRIALEGLPALRPVRLLPDLGAVVHPDLAEAGLLGEAQQVALVEVEQRVLVRLLPLRPDLHGQVLDRRDVEAPVALAEGRVAEDVDRLEDRQPTPGPEHAVQLDERGSLVHEVDEHRAAGGDVHRRVRERQVVGRSLEELAPGRHPQLVRDAAAFVEKVVGDVAEDHTAVLADELERPEADQAVARPDVQHDVAFLDLGVLEHAATELLEVRELACELLRVAREPVLEQPARPAIGH